MLLPPREIRERAEAALLNAPGQLARVIDYLLVTTDRYDTRTPAGWQGPIDLASDIKLERLDDALAGRLLGATELRGENWDLPGRDPVVHAYVRRAWAREDGGVPSNGWDDAGRLYACLILSRLVRDNNTSCEHAVRREITLGGRERLEPFGAFDSHVAYRLHPGETGWLDVSEALGLRDLVAAYDAGGLPDRIVPALRRIESVARERFLEDALPLAVGAAEALLKVSPAYAQQRAGRDCARQQFIQRVPQLGADVGTTISGAQCDAIYRDRSALVHGGGVDLSKPHELSEFEKGFVALVETLRAALRRGLTDAAFAANFAQDSAITASWPVMVKHRGQPVTL
jgi:hypothetical protein